MEDFGLSKLDLLGLRADAMDVYSTEAGKRVFDELFEDLWLYDEPSDEQELILHCFAKRVMKKYFGRFGLSAEHRSKLTKAIMSVPADEENDDE